MKRGKRGRAKLARVAAVAPIALTGMPPGYVGWLDDAKARILAAQQRAALAANSELLSFYWHLWAGEPRAQAREGWGANVIDRLPHDLHVAFPNAKGYSPRNLKCMHAFADAWPGSETMQRLLHKLPWFRLRSLLDKVKDANSCRSCRRSSARPSRRTSRCPHPEEFMTREVGQ